MMMRIPAAAVISAKKGKKIMNIWEMLGIARTKELSAIKRAYAKMAVDCNPEEHEQEFLKLRSAYEQAVLYATDQEERAEKETDEEEPSFTWDFFEEEYLEQNKFKSCEAILKFHELYHVKKSSDKNIWIKYFVSPEFLEVFFCKGFCQALEEEFSEDQAYKAVNKAFLPFLKLFYSAYDQINGTGIISEEHHQVMAEIYKLTDTNIQQSKLSSLEKVIYEGYKNYCQLLELSEAHEWNEDSLRTLTNILDRFVISYIYDKITDQIIRDREYLPRHISSLKLLDYFFATASLPKDAYRLLFDRLDLANAKMGRNYVLYGNLRNLALSKYPELEQKTKHSFADLRSDHIGFCVSLKNQSAELAEKTVFDFFAREDFQLALTDEGFVHDDIFHYWLTDTTNGCFLETLIVYCKAHEDVAFRKRIIDTCEQILRQRRINLAAIQDGQADINEDMPVDVKNRAFFRYLLPASFHNAYSTEHEVYLSALLRDCFPPSSEWRDRFLEKERAVSINLGSRKLDILFHGLYVEYRLEGSSVYGPFISFHTLAATEDSGLFWLLLPLSFAHNNNREAVNQEILKRLEELDFLSDCPRPIIAACLSQSICCEFDSEETYRLSLLKIHREYNGLLHSCYIYLYQEIVVQIVRTEVNGFTTLLGQHTCTDVSQAIEYGNWQLEQLSNPFDPNTLEIQLLPKSVSATIKYAPSRYFSGEEVTMEAIRELLALLITQRVTRLELNWSRYCIVILTNMEKYVLFCLDNIKKYRYTFLSDPGMYQNADSRDIEYQNFLYGKLPEYVIHDNPQAILNRLGRIIEQVSSPDPDFSHDPNAWQLEVYLHKPHQYKLDKCLLAGFPIYTPGEFVNEKFVISVYPNKLCCKEPDQELKCTALSSAMRPLVSDHLFSFFNDQINRLILSWPDRHIALFSSSENGGFTLLYLDDMTRFVHILVFDKNKYLSLDKKNKCSFIEIDGFKFPDFCVHKTADKIHAYLNILLPCIQSPEAILAIPFEFVLLDSYSKKKENWNYEEFKEGLLR